MNGRWGQKARFAPIAPKLRFFEREMSRKGGAQLAASSALDECRENAMLDGEESDGVNSPQKRVPDSTAVQHQFVHGLMLDSLGRSRQYWRFGVGGTALMARKHTASMRNDWGIAGMARIAQHHSML